MITELTLAGFMGIPPESEETPAIKLNLGRFNVIIGANGAGKTTILRALSYLPRLLRREAQYIFREELWIHNRRKNVNIDQDKLIINYLFQWPVNEEKKYGRFNIVGRRSVSYEEELGFLKGGKWDFQRRILKDLYNFHKNPLDGTLDLYDDSKEVALHFSQSKLTHLDAGAIRKFSRLDKIDFQSTGEGLTGYLAEMTLNNYEKMDAIHQGVKSVIPNFERVRFERVSDEPAYQMLIDTTHGKGIPAHIVSDGTLLTIALMAALHADPAPNLLLLDNLDQGLHPVVQGDLVQNLRKILELRPELQIVATTQSPYLVDYCAPDEVIVAAYDDDKGTPVYKKMIEHPEYEAAKDVLKLGEFWSFAGEQWVTGKDTKSITEE